MRKLNAFTWGYHGWGGASAEFVRAVDALERKRGYKPPVFVDLRISRGVRAANFRGNVFQSVVGPRRYVWMRRLGNERILRKRGPRIQICEPAAASELLDRIIALHGAGRRVIMFCSCRDASLDSGDGGPGCHRVTVASLVLREATKQGVQLAISEWPGEKPRCLRVTANAVQHRALATDARYIPIGPVGVLPKLASLGWGSAVTFESLGDSATILTGPACVRKGQWRLEVMEGPWAGPNATAAARRARHTWLKRGYGPRENSRR